MFITHDVLIQKAPTKKRKSDDIELFELASELHEELASMGIIDRLKELNQLGPIRVRKKQTKTRYDYLMLQLYLHQMIRKSKIKLDFSYGNALKAKEFPSGTAWSDTDSVLTMGDGEQLLTIAYNLGHFYNTFTASRAVLMLAETDPGFREKLVSSSKDPRFRATFEQLIDQKDYKQIHLMNSILVLEQADPGKRSVGFAIELLYAYLHQAELPPGNKLSAAFRFYKGVRDVSYISYDMQIARTPFRIDLQDEDALVMFFKELMETYNDNTGAVNLIGSMDKLLDDTLYNEKSAAIAYCSASITMANKAKQGCLNPSFDFYQDYWLSKDSIFNQPVRKRMDFISGEILKITFNSKEKREGIELFSRLKCLNNVRVGFYERRKGEWTLLVALGSRCANKTHVAMNVLKKTVSTLRTLNVDKEDRRYVVAAKFFLYFLFDQQQLMIKPTISRDVGLLCTRGSKDRTGQLTRLLAQQGGTEDQRHEVEFMRELLFQDKRNDTSIVIPASVIVSEKEKNCQHCEFDGLIIHPMRTENQVILLESKNKKFKPGQAKKELKAKLQKLSIRHDSDGFIQHDHDCCISLTI